MLCVANRIAEVAQFLITTLAERLLRWERDITI
jgi:hypothetical protein